ncbi:MAG: LapA family protein [Burkholderiaceae bacterium]
MNRTMNLIVWSLAGLVAVLAAVNWTTLMAAAPLNLVVAEVQAPLGVVLLAMAVALAAVFLVAYLRHQIGSLLEARRLLKEIQRVQQLADQAEASRIESLRQLITAEFRRLDERMSLSERLGVNERMNLSERVIPGLPDPSPIAANQAGHAA